MERSPAVALGVLASVLLHAAGLAAFAFAPAPVRADERAETALILPLESQRPPEAAPPKPAPPDEPEVRPGIDDAKTDTKSWQGFSEQTDHAAPKSNVEQAALTPAPGAPTPEAPRAPSPPEHTDAPSPAPTPAPAVEPPPREQPPVEPRPGLEQVGAHETPQAPPERPPAIESLGDEPPAPPRLIEPVEAILAAPVDPWPMLTPTPALEAPPAPETPPAPAARTPPGASPGERSDSESEATSLKDPIDIKLGKPLAGKGLKITTVRPNWSITTRLTARPRNPVVAVRFARDGRVLKADFVKEQSTGYADVDEPLLNAIRRWRASGKELEKIPADDPRAGVSMTFRIILRE